jgi:8-oxo-dGTP pyrophosphatase MutT (NUDIX family)
MVVIRDSLLRAAYRLALIGRAAVWELRRPTLIGVRSLVVRGDQLLLIRHRSGERPWSLPGGGVDRHERMAEAARREVYEEAGVPVRVDRLLGVYDAFRGETTNYIAVFVCTPLAEPDPSRSLEIAEVRYVGFGELPEGLDAGSRRRVDEYLAGAQGTTALW